MDLQAVSKWHYFSISAIIKCHCWLYYYNYKLKIQRHIEIEPLKSQSFIHINYMLGDLIYEHKGKVIGQRVLGNASEKGK
jgi:hypothetical protein